MKPLRSDLSPLFLARHESVRPLLSGLTFDDVLILPAKTDVRPDETELTSEVVKGLRTALPVLSAPMESVWSIELTIALAKAGATAPISRDLSIAELEKTLRAICSHQLDSTEYPNSSLMNGRPVTIVTSSPFDRAKIDWLSTRNDVDYILLDSVQPFSSSVLRTVEDLSRRLENRVIIGNIATAEAAEEFCRYPIAGLKVGLGPGSICTTREISGVGVPQLHAIEEVSSVAKLYGVPVIADGGIRKLGDIAKAIAAGANSVMLGRLFAGTDESPGKIILEASKQFKHYAGSTYSSVEIDHQSAEIEFGSHIDGLLYQNHRTEGISGYVPYVGPAKFVLLQIQKGLGVSLAFVGARTIEEFQKKARFLKVTPSSNREGSAHSISVVTQKNAVFCE